MSTSFLTLPQPGAVNQALSTFTAPLQTVAVVPGWTTLKNYQVTSFSTVEAVTLSQGAELYRVYGGLGEATGTGHY
ncbi:MAG: hypothetical protein ACI976_000075 [Aureispira sp.]|jgi:hypothetical protein